jgi:hypothetical protein
MQNRSSSQTKREPPDGGGKGASLRLVSCAEVPNENTSAKASALVAGCATSDAAGETAKTRKSVRSAKALSIDTKETATVNAVTTDPMPSSKTGKRGRYRPSPEQRKRLNHREPWSDEDVELLTVLWGVKGSDRIAEDLNRTQVAVEEKASNLGLPPKNEGYFTVHAMSEETGYTEYRIRSAAKFLQIKISKAFNSGLANSTFARHSRISIIQKEQILAFLAKYPDGKHIPRKERFPTELWGVNGRPNACVRCQSHTRPHYSKHFCRPCYPHSLKWGENGRPKACEGCHRNDGVYQGKGLCYNCDRRRRYAAKK